MSRKRIVTLALAGGTLALATVGVAPASGDTASSNGVTRLSAQLDPLNESGVTGDATARIARETIRRIDVRADGLTPDGAHAVHIHYGEQARHECPTFRDDSNGDFRLNVAEGLPQYGPIAVSLTTSGDTSPSSALALDRMPVAENGQLRYTRSDLQLTEVTDVDGATLSASAVAAGIRAGQGVVVIHGVDYNEDGSYGDSRAGASELDPSGQTPAEATDPVACGILQRHGGHSH